MTTTQCAIHNVPMSQRGTGHVKIFFCAVCFPQLKTLECYSQES